MNERDLHRYEDRLIALRDRLTSEVSAMVESVRSRAHPPGEHDSLVSESLRKELVLEGTEEELWSQVVAALERIENGRFGLCERCGRAISKARLDAVPYAPYCIACERKIEASAVKEAIA